MKNLKNVITVAMVILCSVTSYAQSQQDIAGEYSIGNQNTIIKIEQKDDVYSGRIISSDNPKAKVGTLMVEDLKQDKKGNWKGQVYAPKRDEWYDAEFAPKGNILEIKISVGFFSKTMEWKKQ